MMGSESETGFRCNLDIQTSFVKADFIYLFFLPEPSLPFGMAAKAA